MAKNAEVVAKEKQSEHVARFGQGDDVPYHMLLSHRFPHP